MVVLGAVQVQKTDMRSRYFDKYMLALNSGAATTRLISSFITSDKTYFIVCVVTATALTLAAILFIIGWRYYIDTKPYDSVIMMCIPVVTNAFRSRSQYKDYRRSVIEEGVNSVTTNTVYTIKCPTEEEEPVARDHCQLTLLDFAKVPNGGKFHDRTVDDVKSLQGASIVFGFLIPYFIVYNQARSL